MSEEERKIIMNSYISKDKFIEMLNTLEFSNIKLCYIELITGYKLTKNENDEVSLTPLTTELKIDW